MIGILVATNYQDLLRLARIADLTCDGVVNIDDIDAFAGAFLAGQRAADLDASGTLTLDDLDLFVASFLLGCP